ncbi:MAG: 4-oxalomesaconate tautomerase [Spongiibacter sp.]|uniref:4-oxalomesaconate tautomerase n=1 Tax=Spongiibacter TaxID=630749 RepID=UPI001B29F301|nr:MULTISPECIES: 4-oxalomesaconate tautomerase [Spongiibacter]MBO6753418.1 4-oxalomesaconate tautomerase [Spongiibacter sp.]|tara:strand:- start:6667 stop:7767 length:1101 start_codon:yes stop_codon:yes gene_type:complete
MQKAIPCQVMRGGTSKGLYFLASDLPTEAEARNRLLLAAMGSPDARQIDGMGGAHPLTSKVAVISPSSLPSVDVDYLFLQVVVDKAEVSDAQNCGNILAGVGPFAIENGLVAAEDGHTDVRIHMVNTGARATARVETPGGSVNYVGQARIDGVPGTAAPIPIDFLDIAGSSCGALLPTGNTLDVIDGVEVSCIDNGMPVVLLRAADFGLSGSESPAELEANAELKARIESIRLAAGKLMNLGDVTSKTVPKMSLISEPLAGGAVNTRTFIPHRVHEAIGVLGSVSVATGCMLPGSVAQSVAAVPAADGVCQLEVEHPTGFFTVEMDVAGSDSMESFTVKRAALLRTARLLMRGEVMVPAELESGHG